MKIIGIGVDITKNSRIKNMLKNRQFVNRIFSKDEINSARKKFDKTSFFAKRFAAKEAFSKAFGTGISGDVRLKEIRILRNENGKPYMHAGKVLKKHMNNLGIREAHVSLSDEDNYVIAYALLER